LNPVDAFWHVANFFAPAVVTGLLAAAGAKLLWRRALAGVGVSRLAGWAGGAMALALLGGLVIFGHDGKMATYSAMVVACAAALWWAGFRKHG